MASPPTSQPFDFMWAPSPSPLILPLHPAAKPSPTNQFSPPLIALVAVISTAFLIFLYSRFISFRLRRLLRQLRRHRRRRRLLLSTSPSPSPSPFHPPLSSSSADDDYFFSTPPFAVGLDDSAIKSLPLSFFKSVINSLIARDCAVCLLEFEDGDSLRTLPLCSHAFHVDCIDVWLRSHATCPLCRSSVFRQDPPFIPMRAARIRPSFDDIILESDSAELDSIVVPSPPPDRDFLLKRSYSFGFERNLEVSTATPWRNRNNRGGSFWSKRWASPFNGGSSSTSSRIRAFSSRSQRGFSVKSPFVKRRGFFPLSEGGGVRFNGVASTRRSRAMTSPSAIFMRSMMVTSSAGMGFDGRSSRMRCGDPEALLSP